MKLEAIRHDIEEVSVEIPIISSENAFEEQLERVKQIIASQEIEHLETFGISDCVNNLNTLLQNCSISDDLVGRAINTMGDLQTALSKLNREGENSKEIEKNKNNNKKSEGKSKVDIAINTNSDNSKKSRNKSIQKCQTFPPINMSIDHNLYPLDHKDFPNSGEVKVCYPGMGINDIKKHIHAVQGVLS
jgi:hypothetical protein